MIDLTKETWYTVPAGTAPTWCQGKRFGGTCNVKLYKVPSQKKLGSTIPIDCTVEGGSEPTADTDGRGISHFRTCPDVNLFSTKRIR